MFAQAVFLVQFTTLMLAVGMIPFLPDTITLPGSGALPLLGLLVGTALLAAFAPQLLHRILRSARVPVPMHGAALRRTDHAARFALPTDPGHAGGPQPRAPAALPGAHA